MKVPEKLEEIRTTLTQCIGDHRGESHSLTEIVPGIFSSLGSFHALESLELETVCQVESVPNGHVHNESSVGCEITPNIRVCIFSLCSLEIKGMRDRDS